MSVRHFLDVDDLTGSEVLEVLDLADQQSLPPVLAGKGVALLFEKPSARTRHSTEIAVIQLGGHPITTRADEIGFDVREPVEDLTRVFSRYHALIGARVFAHSTLHRMTAVAEVPVINLLSEHSHPLQTLADLLTVRRNFGDLKGVEIAWIGDFSNVGRSLAVGAALVGAHFTSASPDGYGPTPHDLERFAALGGPISVHANMVDAVRNVQVVVTDSWVSMGQESMAAHRDAAFAGWTLSSSIFDAAADDAIFLHCLPAHRGDEVSAEVIDGPRSRVFDEAANRVDTTRALIAFLLQNYE